MKKTTKKWLLSLPLALLTLAIVLQSCEDHRVPPAAPQLPDQIFYALTDNNQLYELNVRNTSAPLRTISITGLEPGEKIMGIDFRPATGQLYSVGSTSRLYHINIQSGAATALGAGPFVPGIQGSMVGFDFNPTVDRIRLVTNTTQDLRLHPETGVVVSIDGNLNGYPNPMVAAVAYSNSFAGTTTTKLYDIDANTDRLYLQDPPNDGGLKDIGPLGIDISAVGGFDLSSDENYGIASVMYQGKWELDYVDLMTGQLRKLGDLPSGTITGIAIPTRPVAYAVDVNNTLHIFNPKKFPFTSITRSITGLPAGVNVEGIDFRPVNGQLHALGTNGNLYAINLSNGAVSFLSVLSVALDGSSFGVDFNPVADRLRIVSNNRQNLRVNVTTGAAIIDGTLTPVSGTATPFVNGAAYTNSFAGTTSTVLYDIDSQSNKLFKQDPPNGGGLVEIGNLGVVVDAANGFDIGGTTGDAYALLTVGGVSGFYKINLTTGAAFRIADFPAGVKGLALGFGL